MHARFHPRTRPVLVVSTFLCAVVGATACRGGCAREQPPGGALVLVPPQARFVAAVDFAAIRSTPVWKGLSSLAAQDEKDRRQLAELEARTGVDPLRHVHRLLVAFPEEARRDGAFAVVVEGERFDEARLLAYARDQAQAAGKQLVSRARSGRSLWGTGRPEDPAGFFLDERRFVLASAGWAELIADRAAGAAPIGAGLRPELRGLLEEVAIGSGKTRPPLWFVGLVPGPRDAGAGSGLPGGLAGMFGPVGAVAEGLSRVGIGLDLSSGIRGRVVAGYASHAIAREQAAKASTWIAEVKRSPTALLLGAGPYLEGVVARAKGTSMEVDVTVSERLTVDLVARLGALRQLGKEGAR